MADKEVFGFFRIFICPHVSTCNEFTRSSRDHGGMSPNMQNACANSSVTNENRSDLSFT